MRWFLAASTRQREGEAQKILRGFSRNPLLSELFGPNPVSRFSVTP